MRKVAACLALIIVAIAILTFSPILWLLGVQTVVVTDYNKPVPKADDPLVDDVFDATKVPEFDPQRIDSRLADGWSVNLSATETKLELDLLYPGIDAQLLKLRPSYLEALRAVQSHLTVLPSVNLIDGKAKQFDDGLYAALEEHWFQAREGDFRGDLDFLQRLAAAVPADGEAAAYFAVGLDMAGITVPATNQAAKTAWKSRFESREVQTKPIGFYSWTPRLKQCYRVSRFFQLESPLKDIKWMQVIVDALRQHSDLQADYRQILARWARLSNAPWQLTVLDLVDNPDRASLERIRHERHPAPASVALIPAGTNRESELTRKLFPSGFSASDDLMREMVTAIRRGDIDLQPTDKSGWYDYQVYALETLLVPKRGEESNRLLLSGTYKRRMLEAFQALMTKRKETHILRSESAPKAAAMPLRPLSRFSPRLRLEPAPTYYLRMARSYRFLDRAVRELVGESQLAEMHGLREEGARTKPLLTELRDMQRLFYGCYALSAEDIGMGLSLMDEELAELDECRIAAETWLTGITDDPDLGVDTRVIVPVAEDVKRSAMSTWATLGIRFARLNASYHPDAPPRVKTSEQEQWTALTPDQLGASIYLTLVDEFASVQIPNSRVLARDEFRKLCNDSANREEAIKKLQQPGAGR